MNILLLQPKILLQQLTINFKDVHVLRDFRSVYNPLIPFSVTPFHPPYRKTPVFPVRHLETVPSHLNPPSP